MQQDEEELERPERRCARVDVAVVQPWLDRFGIPVAEVVEGEVVQHARRGGEVELAPGVLDRDAGGVDPGEDPVLLERRGPRIGPDVLDILEDEA
jgi:hypothetical protein